MARPREFDLDEATQKALLAFWQRGYESTSIADLMEAMGIEKGSLYKAYGDKRSLYLTALERYLATGMGYHQGILVEDRPFPTILREWLHSLNEHSRGDHGATGCMAVHAMIEVAPHDAEIRDRLVKHWQELVGLLKIRLAQGQSRGEVRTDCDAEALAEILLRTMGGLAAFSRLGQVPPAHIVETLVQLFCSAAR
ncbi:TetR/AcrR family transcriptional regulator [Tuwongella immobilis]|uniref:HTH tetR-type domain-containing protein n=1 Tax=Tuwongella immobilis TaxID=692036 RepID=A0A6C2YIA2_9BACT|nr:TetR/AcrR family transcriptional regulator [Tuwongella immobilis]VIP01147.1 family transcriptional regulator : Putative transcriptional regulator, TetR family OS=Streptosporangium roseum (strain ATCC 12428 / DSM 43021 / JCM 3005 / NI 9100) GN=Sros_4260 PE=4 SV=1: TetR_N [Tuwongella immobilis]VTR97720.1 family transcriptional regulator : Putative transcriptional regulator, TetR family OS=Streptosporangium roseum (strain ATCC 12428 / DSM 43021 / JCM 3005 / NI 9100) GN=Sros_4260 PE=4 SV=1: TetR_N